MKFSIAAIISLVASIAIPQATNYELLVNAITSFQDTSDATFELILAALAQEKELLDSFSASTVGNVTIFVPSDADHVAINAPSTQARHVKTYLGDDVSLNYTASALTQVITRFGAVSNVLGSVTPIQNVALNFVDDVLHPPVSLNLTASHYNYTNYTSLLSAAQGLTLTSISKDNTFLIPSEAAISAFVAAQGSPANYTAEHFAALMNYHTITVARIYAQDFTALAAQNITTITTASNGTLSFTVVNGTHRLNTGTIAFQGAFGNATVTTADILTEHGVSHVIDAILTPLNVTY